MNSYQQPEVEVIAFTEEEVVMNLGASASNEWNANNQPPVVETETPVPDPNADL